MVLQWLMGSLNTVVQWLGSSSSIEDPSQSKTFWPKRNTWYLVPGTAVLYPCLESYHASTVIIVQFS